MTIFLNVQYLQDYIDLKLPALDYANPDDVGIDLFSVEDMKLYRNIPQRVRTGIKIEIPKGYGGFLFPKSGKSLENVRMANCVGVIDPSYRGEVQAPLIYDGIHAYTKVRAKQAIVQLIVIPCPTVICNAVNQLDTTERGEGGFGSTQDKGE